MKIKTFEAANMEEALAKAREELGEDAVVLNTKHVKTGGVIGASGQTRVELMAAVDDSAPGRSEPRPDIATPVAPTQTRQPEQAAPQGQTAPQQTPGTQQAQPGGSFASQMYAKTAATNQAPQRDDEIAELRNELKSLAGLVNQLIAASAGSSQTASAGQAQAPAKKAVTMASRLGIDEDLARRLLPELLTTDDPAMVVNVLASKLQAFAVPPTTDEQQIIAVVGPTGVGKTTTLAKLAARFALEQGKSVALVSADTYRIGAVEQLRTYARIMNVPIEVGLSPQEVAKGVQMHHDKDVILIDTVGRSQRSNEHLAELKTFVDAAQPSDIYLVVAASLAGEVQKEVVERFSTLSPTRLVITKLDEAPDNGSLVNLPLRTGLGVSCITAGQNVPQDIDFADAGRMARMVVEVA